MKSIRHLISGLLASLLLVSVVSASAYLGPHDQNWQGNEDLIKTVGMFIGTNDNFDNGLKAGVAAAYLQQLFIPYGPSSYWAGTRGEASGVRTSEMIGDYIGAYSAIGDNVENVFIYIGGHGRKGSSTLPYMILVGSSTDGSIKYTLEEYELAYYLSQLPSDMNKWVILDACYSGGFINQLKKLENISILTSSFLVTKYSEETGKSYFEMVLEQFFIDQEGKGFSSKDLVDYMRRDSWVERFLGMRSYISGELGELSEPSLFTAQDWTIEFYESPTYASQNVPEPTTMLLLGLGLIGLAVVRKRIGI